MTLVTINPGRVIVLVSCKPICNRCTPLMLTPAVMWCGQAVRYGRSLGGVTTDQSRTDPASGQCGRRTLASFITLSTPPGPNAHPEVRRSRRDINEDIGELSFPRHGDSSDTDGAGPYSRPWGDDGGVERWSTALWRRRYGPGSVLRTGRFISGVSVVLRVMAQRLLML